jgi:hypothetical protein
MTSVAELRDLESAGVQLSEAGIERIRLDDQARAEEEARQKAQAADALKTLKRTAKEYTQGRDELLADAPAYIAKVDRVREQARAYEAALRWARSLGVKIDTPPVEKIETLCSRGDARDIRRLRDAFTGLSRVDF